MSTIKLANTIQRNTAEPPIYETEPLVVPGTSISSAVWVLNQVIELGTTLQPLELLSALKQIEQKLGRQPRPKWSDREIDLDILVYNDLHLHTPELTLPHPELAKRKFVLVPLVDIAPQFASLLAECQDILTIRPYEPNRN